MMDQELVRNLILRAPPDLLLAIYERSRRQGDIHPEGPSWPQIVRAAQGLGIFTAEEALAFARFIAGRCGKAA